MIYANSAVSVFAQQIANRAGYRPVYNKPYTSWDQAVKDIEELRTKDLQSKLIFAQFVMSISRAKEYLELKDRESLLGETWSSADRNKYLDDYLDWSKTQAEKLFATSPSVINMMYAQINPTKAAINTSPKPSPEHQQREREREEKEATKNFINNTLRSGKRVLANVIRDRKVDLFVASEPFKKLQKYKDSILTTDLRSHSYFCGLIDLKVEKASVLKTFLDDLDSARTMSEVQQTINEFYRGKDGSNNNQPTPYQILNTGQNITTRFFGAFGMRTTTISLIDDLVSSIDASADQNHQL